MELTTEITSLPKVGPAMTKVLHKLGVFTVRDLLVHFPYRYLDFRKTFTIADVRENEVVTIRAFIKSINVRRSFKTHMALTEGVVSDETGSIKVMWFNQPYLAKTLQKDDEVLLSGKVDRYKTLQLVNPVYEKFSDEHLHTGRLVPVYHSAESIPNRTLRNLIHTSLKISKDLEAEAEELPSAIAKKLGLLTISEAIEKLHFPENYEDIDQGRFRIAFDDILPQQLAVELQALENIKLKTFTITPNIDQVKSFLATLPFELTASQKRSAWDIFQDLSLRKPMNRLLQGDVGSGKTLVALLAALQVGNHNLQTALLAPTEILARQHYETIQNYLKNYP
ncbi:MAG: DEAD/DEAH box helicase, partial [bacterium]|nr:DEAD/DEAH box helicase [bacterium]